MHRLLSLLLIFALAACDAEGADGQHEAQASQSDVLQGESRREGESDASSTTTDVLSSGDDASLRANDASAMEVLADDIPVAHTPDCGWETFPPAVLETCTEALLDGAPDLRGLWQAIDGPVGRIERIEQCGNRVVITSGGVIHDMRADGTLENGVNDVSGMNCQEIHVRAEFIDNMLVLSPEGVDIQVKRWLEGDMLVVDHPIIAGQLERIDALPSEADKG